jgi:hypothetical protein
MPTDATNPRRTPRRTPLKRGISIDADPDNADWSKARSWDLWNDDGTPITTLEQLRGALLDTSDAALKQLLELPVARSMPRWLKRQIEAL